MDRTVEIYVHILLKVILSKLSYDPHSYRATDHGRDEGLSVNLFLSYDKRILLLVSFSSSLFLHLNNIIVQNFGWIIYQCGVLVNNLLFFFIVVRLRARHTTAMVTDGFTRFTSLGLLLNNLRWALYSVFDRRYRFETLFVVCLLWIVMWILI